MAEVEWMKRKEGLRRRERKIRMKSDSKKTRIEEKEMRVTRIS